PRPLRPGRPAPAAAAARDRRPGLSAREPHLLGAGRPVLVGRADGRRAGVIRRAVRWVDRRSGTAPFLHRAIRYLFPDHWSFLLGEVALYAFLLLVATGVYLTFFFRPDTSEVVYHGGYAPLRGQEMSQAYKSVVDISFEVKAGLLIRQTHHWAA